MFRLEVVCLEWSAVGIKWKKDMRDWHTHILPEMDDGSGSVEESIEMLAAETAQGVDEIVLTPHFYAHREDAAEFLRRREASFQKLLAGLDGQCLGSARGIELGADGQRSEVRDQCSVSSGQEAVVSGQKSVVSGQGAVVGGQGSVASEQSVELRLPDGAICPRLLLGAEVYYFDGLYKMKDEYMDALCFGRRRYLLIEMPFASWTKQELDVVRMTALRQQVTPMLAHVDRYLGYKGNIKLLPELADMGAVFQINVESIVKGFAGRHVRRVIDEYGAVFGTDCHNMTSRRPEGMISG